MKTLMLSKTTQKKGFTIVELLIVIVVIGILAAITIVAYNGIQSRARDAQTRDAVSKVAKATQIWSINHGQPPSHAGYGSTAKNADGTCTGGTGGWIAGYVCSIGDMLSSDKLLANNFFTSLPVNKSYGGASDGRLTLMLYPCTADQAQTYALFYYLENPTAQDAADVTKSETAGCPTSPRLTYGMRGARMLSF